MVDAWDGGGARALVVTHGTGADSSTLLREMWGGEGCGGAGIALWFEVLAVLLVLLRDKLGVLTSPCSVHVRCDDCQVRVLEWFLLLFSLTYVFGISI